MSKQVDTGQATSDYHRLLREPTDWAAIVVFHPVSEFGWEKADKTFSASSPCHVGPKRHSWSDH